tara:strand:+ start:111 stop:425 length:315 start_codon:yes stop_codon:yes gene_type:complete
MKHKKETIIYLEFLDHSSTSNLWQTEEEFNEDCIIEPCKAIGFLEKEDNLAFYISTMKSRGEKGSGHVILKSACTYIKKIPQKTFFKSIEHINSKLLIDTPLNL